MCRRGGYPLALLTSCEVWFAWFGVARIRQVEINTSHLLSVGHYHLNRQHRGDLDHTQSGKQMTSTTNRISLIVTLFFCILFLILAIAIKQWVCGGIFTTECSEAFPTDNPNQAVGGLIATAIILYCCCVIAEGCIWFFFKDNNWLPILNIVLSGIASIFTMAAILTYFNRNLPQNWSVLLGAIGFTLGWQVFFSMTVNFARGVTVGN